MSLKSAIREIIPPIILRLILRVCNYGITYKGEYATWKSALESSSGYESPIIIESVCSAAKKVKNGDAVYERDSVCFYKEQYRWPTLACLLRVAAENEGKMNVLDYGGSLGSYYFQHKKYFSCLKRTLWAVVEQPAFVSCGQREFEDDTLRFYASIDECLQNSDIDVVLMSAVLQYLQDPESVLEKVCSIGARFIIIDRIPYVDSVRDRLTVQTVPGRIYNVSYPAWFFSEKRLMGVLKNLKYSVVSELPCDDRANIVSKYRGLFLEKTEKNLN